MLACMLWTLISSDIIQQFDTKSSESGMSKEMSPRSTHRRHGRQSSRGSNSGVPVHGLMACAHSGSELFAQSGGSLTSNNISMYTLAAALLHTNYIIFFQHRATGGRNAPHNNNPC